MIEIEKIAEILKKGYLSYKTRNRLIKKALAEHFGYRNVSVRRDKYIPVWVEIKVRVKKPDHKCLLGQQCEVCKKITEETKLKVQQILDETNLSSDLKVYLDKLKLRVHTYTITVELID